jgi:O-glycosyl hydrolase
MNRWIGILIVSLSAIPGVSAQDQSVAYWLTDTRNNALTPYTTEIGGSPGGGKARVIEIDETATFQSIVGIGSSIEHATAYNLSLLPEEKRREVLERLVHPEKGIGMDFMRICIGTSDFAGEPWYTYNDLPEGETDLALDRFSIEKDRAYVLPAIKIAKEINPDLQFLASPWSPPPWMKTNNAYGGGKVYPKYYDVYARYLLKFVQAYEAEGVPVYAITLQNEPQYPNPDYPTSHWEPEDQQIFIRDHVGPLFADANVDPLIWCWDHNYNMVEFPRTILSDPKAAKYVDGTAFHFYEGEPEAMTELHEEFPDKHIYFTEGSAFGPRGAVTIIKIFRNWARSYLAWVTMLDQDRKPNNGPHHASPTAIMLNTNDMSIEYRFDYYMYGQFSKFIDRGAVRVASTEGDHRFNNVAFRNPDGKMVLVVANNQRGDETVEVRCAGKTFRAELPGRGVATFVWEP